MKEKIFDGIPVKMSEKAKDLILRMLCYDKNERITISEIESHSFVKLSILYNNIYKMSDKRILCDYIDPITHEKIFVEIDSDNIIGHSTFMVFLGCLKNSKGRVLQNVAIKDICIEREQISAEAEIMKKVKHHENIVSLYHTYRPETKVKIAKLTKLSLIMEYCDGCDLGKFLEKNPELPEWKIRDFFKQIVNGLGCLHSEKIMHRDIKPQNIFLTKENKILKIGDYGISKFIKLDMTTATMFKGTYGFMAPEVIDKQIHKRGSIGYPADIFSLGVTLYYMYFQKQPWSRNGQNISMGELINVYRKILGKDGEDIFPPDMEISTSARNLILKMLTLEPIQRIKIPEILEDTYMKEDFPLVKNPKTTKLFLKLDAEANKIMLVQDLQKKIYKNDKFCENKLIWLNSLFSLCKYINLSTLSLELSLRQEKNIKNPWFPKENWLLFYQDELYKIIVKKVKIMTMESMKNLETLLNKIKPYADIIIEDKKSTFLEDCALKLKNLLKEYKKTLKQQDEDDNSDKLLITIYQLITVLSFIEPNLKSESYFKFENFQNNLIDNLQKKRWVILQRLKSCFTNLKI